MAESPFRNFDLEKIQDADLYAIYTSSRIGTYGVARLLLHCCVTCSENGPMLNNEQYAAIVEQIPTHDAQVPPRGIEYADYLLTPPPLPIKDISYAQYHAVRAIMLVDDSLDMVRHDGWTVDVTERLLLASAWESDARNTQLDNTHQRSFIKIDKQWVKSVADGAQQAQKNIGRENIKKGTARAGTKLHDHELQKSYALQLYKDGLDKGKWRKNGQLMPRAAAIAITPEVQRYAIEKNLRYKLQDNAEDTIYKHLLKQAPKRTTR